MYSWFPESGSGLSAPLRKNGLLLSVVIFLAEGSLWAGKKERWIWFGDRSVSKADGNQLTLDAPLTMALDNKWGTVKVLRYSWPAESQKQVWRI